MKEYWKFNTLGAEGKYLKTEFAERAFVPNAAFPRSEMREYNKKFHNVTPKIQKIELKSRSKECDFISGEMEIGGKGILLSEKAYELFKMFRLPEHKTYNVNVELDGNLTRTKYLWMHVINFNIWEDIDFVSSDIRRKKNGYKVNSKEDYAKLSDLFEGEALSFKEIEFKTKKLDIFKLNVGLFYWISHELYQEIKNQNLTGYYPFEKALPFETQDAFKPPV